MKLKYFGMRVKNKNSIYEEFRSTLKSENVCYYSVRNPLSSSVTPKNENIKRHKIIILLVILYGCETGILCQRKTKD
jgi:hypothetical protein